MSFLNKLANLVILNFCFLVCSIFVIPFGAALTALYSVNLRMVRDEEAAYVFRSYWKAFCKNFRQSTICWFFMAAAGAILYLDIRAAGMLSGTVGFFVQIMTIVFIVCYAILFLYVFPYIGWFEDRLFTCMKNAFIIGGIRIGYTVTMLLIAIAVFMISVFDAEVMLRTLILWIVFGFALLNYIQCMFLRRVFSKYEKTSKMYK